MVVVGDMTEEKERDSKEKDEEKEEEEVYEMKRLIES